jgi:hypothetical protein
MTDATSDCVMGGRALRSLPCRQHRRDARTSLESEVPQHHAAALGCRRVQGVLCRGGDDAPNAALGADDSAVVRWR